MSRVTTWVAIRPIQQSLRLIGRRSRLVLVTLSVVQLLLSGLDLLGVLLLGAVATIGVSGPGGIASSGLFSRMFDLLGLVAVPDTQLIVGFAIAAAAILLVKSVLSITFVRITLRFLAAQQAAVSKRLIRGLLSQSLLVVQRQSSYELTFALTQGVSAATTGLLGSATIALNEMGLIMVLGFALLFIDPIATVASFAYFAAVGLLLSIWLGRKIARIGNDQAAKEVASLSAIQEAIHSFREVTVTHRRDLYIRDIAELRRQAANVGADAQFLAQVPKYTMEFAMVVGGVLLAAALFATRQPASAVGLLVLFILASSRIMPAMMRLQSSFLAIRLSAGVATSTYALAEELVSGEEAHDSYVRSLHIAEAISRGYEAFDPHVLISNVTLTYPQNPVPAVDGCTLDVVAGSTVAIVGPSGAGKSSIADLILGVLTPETGTIAIGGMAPETAIKTWPGAIGYVPQEVALTNSTVRRNVALGLREQDVDDERVWRALELASIASLFRSTEMGLSTLVGERGARLSGGQRQRLGLARALYSGPRLLVLDEATSALDAETEASITEALSLLHGVVTTIVIAHRLATVIQADKVVYIDSGRIVAQGNFDDVRREVPAFERQAKLLGING